MTISCRSLTARVATDTDTYEGVLATKRWTQEPMGAVRRGAEIRRKSHFGTQNPKKILASRRKSQFLECGSGQIGRCAAGCAPKDVIFCN